jgi:hypothetical protein
MSLEEMVGPLRWREEASPVVAVALAVALLPLLAAAVLVVW